MKQCLLPENPAARKTDSLSRLQCHDSGGPGEDFAPDVLVVKELREFLDRFFPELGGRDFMAVFLRGSGELVRGWKSLVS